MGDRDYAQELCDLATAQMKAAVHARLIWHDDTAEFCHVMIDLIERPRATYFWSKDRGGLLLYRGRVYLQREQLWFESAWFQADSAYAVVHALDSKLKQKFEGYRALCQPRPLPSKPPRLRDRKAFETLAVHLDLFLAEWMRSLRAQDDQA